MFDADNLSPFRRKRKEFIIPSSYYKGYESKTVGKVYKEPNVIIEQHEHHSPNNLEKTTEKEELNSLEVKNDAQKNALSNNSIDGVSRYSLSSIKIEREAKRKLDKKTASIESSEDEFTLDMLADLWSEHIKSKISKGENIVAALLGMSHVKLAKTNIIIIETNSVSNKNQIIKEMDSILPFLKKSLNNYKITFQINIVSQTKSNSIYTPKEKYDHLQGMNPDLSLLVNEFKLQI